MANFLVTQEAPYQNQLRPAVSIKYRLVIDRRTSAVFTCIGALGTPNRTGPLTRKYLPGFPYSWSLRRLRQKISSIYCTVICNYPSAAQEQPFTVGLFSVGHQTHQHCSKSVRESTRNGIAYLSLWIKNNIPIGSSKVIKNGAIRQTTYDFLFDFHTNYMPISCSFGDIAWQKWCGFSQQTIGCHDNIPWGIEKNNSRSIIYSRSSNSLQISWRSVRWTLR